MISSNADLAFLFSAFVESLFLSVFLPDVDAGNLKGLSDDGGLEIKKNLHLESSVNQV